MPGRFGYYIPCGEEGNPVEAALIIDGDPVCIGHARSAKPVEAASPDKTAVAEPDLCGRGCGNHSHRGRCKPTGRAANNIFRSAKQQRLPAAIPVEQMKIMPKQQEKKVDTLKFEEVSIDQIPEGTGQRRYQGRAGELLHRLIALCSSKPETSLKVSNRDREHAGYTARHLLRSADKKGYTAHVTRVGTDLYCYLTKKVD